MASTSSNQGPRRIGQWLCLKPESIEEYKKCHAAVWPEVLEQIKDSNIKDCALPFPIPFPFAFLLHPFPPPQSPSVGCLLTSECLTDSIYLSMHPRPTLFASFKYVGHAFDEDMARMARNKKVQEWWAMTDGMQESPIEGAKGSATGPGWWGQTEEVFYVE
jgi:L-rhamnose mutarotase